MSKSNKLKSLATLIVMLASFSVSACVADVASTDEVIDDTTPEVDETELKEDASVRPLGRFEYADFDSYEDSGVIPGYTYGFYFNQVSGSRDYGVNEEQPTLVRRSVNFRFTRSGSKRYLHATETDSAGNRETVRFEYKMSRGVLRLRPVNTSGWFALHPVDAADPDLVDAVKTLYSENQEIVDDARPFRGRLPFRAQLEYDMVDYAWGSDDYAPRISRVTFDDGYADRTVRIFAITAESENDGMVRFLDENGVYLVSGDYGDGDSFEWH